MGHHPIGTGPYWFQVKAGQYIRLVKNPYYWATSQYRVRTLEFDYVPNDSTRLFQVESGQLGDDNTLPYNQISQIQSSSSAHAQFDPSTAITFLVLNNKIAPFNDAKVRQAISHAIDRRALIRAVLNGHGTIANSFLPRGAIDYDPSTPNPTYDPALARKLLSESSVPHGFTTKLEIASGDATQNETAIIIQAELSRVGIKASIAQIDPTTLYADQTHGKYDAAFGTWTNDIPDPDELVSYGLDVTAGNNAFLTGYNNPRVVRLIHRAERTAAPAARRRLYFTIQRIGARDIPFIALYYSPFVNGVNLSVHGFHQTPFGYFVLQGTTVS
jgi:peptide/nickel transport system substrate-binding protein